MLELFGAPGTGVAFIMYYHVIDKLGAVTASSVFSLPPASALLIVTLFANEIVALPHAPGAAWILSVIYLSTPSPRSLAP